MSQNSIKNFADFTNSLFYVFPTYGFMHTLCHHVCYYVWIGNNVKKFLHSLGYDVILNVFEAKMYYCRSFIKLIYVNLSNVMPFSKK